MNKTRNRNVHTEVRWLKAEVQRWHCDDSLKYMRCVTVVALVMLKCDSLHKLQFQCFHVKVEVFRYKCKNDPADRL